MRKPLISIALGQMVLDTVIREKWKPPINEYQNNILLGGPPSFMGINGLIVSKIFPWMFPPLIYAYACPKVITLLKNNPDFDLISKNLKVQSICPHFRLVYSNDGKERKLFLNNPPQQFNLTDFNWKFETPPVAIISSVYDEFNNYNIFNYLKGRCSFVAFDPQGCFRHLVSDNQIILRKWWDHRIIENIDCLKVSETEAKLLGKGNNPLEIVKRILDTSVKSVILTRGKNGAILGYKEKEGNGIRLFKVPTFTESTIEDETGAGDVFLYMYIVYLLPFNDELDAIAFATSVTSLLIEKKRFIAKFTEEEVHLRQKKVRERISEINK